MTFPLLSPLKVYLWTNKSLWYIQFSMINYYVTITSLLKDENGVRANQVGVSYTFLQATLKLESTNQTNKSKSNNSNNRLTLGYLSHIPLDLWYHSDVLTSQYLEQFLSWNHKREVWSPKLIIICQGTTFSKISFQWKKYKMTKLP